MNKILVVEDSFAQREMLAELLRSSETCVIIAKDGTEAIKSATQYRPDLVVLDIVLPGINGYEVCRRLKSNSLAYNPKILMCSAKNEAYERYWCLKQGADAYLTKPFRPSELLSTVKQLLGQFNTGSRMAKQPTTYYRASFS